MNILVTGATKGIGESVCELLGKEHNIYATARNEFFLKRYKNYFVADLSNIGDLLGLGNFIEQNKIDILINNAGGYIYSAVENLSLEQIEYLTRVNFEAPLYLISRAIPYMKISGFGRIINIGSISGVLGEANASLYSATKSGFTGMSKALALELAEYGITVNTINPGWVNTEMGSNSSEAGDFTKEEIIDCIPQKRFVEPLEIANLIKYLISDEARGITGQSINLCAGLTCGC